MLPLYLPIVVLLVTAFLTPLIGTKFKLFRRILVSFAILSTFIFWLYLSPGIFSGEIITYNLTGWTPPFGINLVLDSLSLSLLLLISGISFLISLITEKFLSKRRSEFYCLFLLMLVGMTGIVLTGDLFNMFVFTEILAISSYGLTVFYRDEKSAEAAFKYLLLGAFATSLILLGIAMLYGLTGTLNIADLIAKVSVNKYSLIALGFLLVGYLTEIGAIPFHAWKPDVIQTIPIPIAGIITALSTSVGIYAILRILFFFGLFGVSYLLMILGLGSMILGAFLALTQEDIRRMLAYSSISQIGYILLGFSFGVIGFTGGFFHLINNAFLKALLFLIVGLIIYKTGKVQSVNMPVTSFCFLVASLGIAGIPPLNGFASKFLIYEAGIRAGFWLPTVIAILISALTLAYYLKAFNKLFLNSSAKKIKEDKLFLIPILFLTTICILIGLFPQIITNNLEPVVNALLGRMGYYCSVLGC